MEKDTELSQEYLEELNLLIDMMNSIAKYILDREDGLEKLICSIGFLYSKAISSSGKETEQYLELAINEWKKRFQQIK